MQGKAIYLSADQNSFESYYIYWFSIKFQYVITNTELKQLFTCMETEIITSVRLGSRGFNNSSLVSVMVQSLKNTIRF